MFVHELSCKIHMIRCINYNQHVQIKLVNLHAYQWDDVRVWLAEDLVVDGDGICINDGTCAVSLGANSHLHSHTSLITFSCTRALSDGNASVLSRNRRQTIAGTAYCGQTYVRTSRMSYVFFCKSSYRSCQRTIDAVQLKFSSRNLH